jgi:hypothetical protein
MNPNFFNIVQREENSNAEQQEVGNKGNQRGTHSLPERVDGRILRT